MKKILLLGGSAQQVIAIETAKQHGYYTVLCDYLPDNPGQYAADIFYQVSTTDKAAILEIARKEQIQGILAYASDPAAPTAAYVAQVLGLPGNPADAVEILCNKDRFRKFLKENGFHTPQAKGYAREEDALADQESLPYPVIVKPVDSSGSKGVTVLKSGEGLEEAVRFAFSFSRGKRIVIEQFVQKKHPYLIGGDIFVVDGEVTLWGLLNCHRDPRVNPLVPVGKSYPLALDVETVELVKQTLSAMVRKLDIRNGAMNVELVVDEQNRVWPIDIGPRCGGNMIPDLLGDIFCVNVVEMSVQAAMGVPVTCSPRVPAGCYATHNLHSDRSGSYGAMRFGEDLERRIYRKCLYKKPGDPVEFFDNAAKCLGILFMEFDDREAMQDTLNHIYKDIEITLEA